MKETRRPQLSRMQDYNIVNDHATAAMLDVSSNQLSILFLFYGLSKVVCRLSCHCNMVFQNPRLSALSHIYITPPSLYIYKSCLAILLLILILFP